VAAADLTSSRDLGVGAGRSGPGSAPGCAARNGRRRRAEPPGDRGAASRRTASSFSASRRAA
jgi:hypothetical protein